MLNKMMLVPFVHLSPIAFHKMFWNVVCRFYSVVICTVDVPPSNVFFVAVFVDVFVDSFDCVFVASRVLFVFTPSVRC